MKFNRHALTLFLGFGSLTVLSVFSFTGCDDSNTQGYLQTMPAMTDGNSCVLNGEYYRDGIASHCCSGNGPTSPYPTDCPPIDGSTPGVNQTVTSGIVADQVGAAAGSTASSMEGNKQNVQTGMTSGVAAALAGINGSISSGASTGSGTTGGSIASTLSDGSPTSNTAASTGAGPAHFVAGGGAGAGAGNGSGSNGLGGFGGGDSSKTSVATDGTVQSMPAGSAVAEASSGGLYAAGGAAGGAGRYGSGGGYGYGSGGSNGYGSGLSASDFAGGAAGGNKYVGDLSERNPAGAGGAGGADGAGGAGSTMGTPDPADYFKRLGIGDNIFKIVEKRYTLKTKQWALADANGVARSAGVPMPASAKAAVPAPAHK